MGLRKHSVNKASRSNGIPAELFKILKDDVIKVLHSICQHIWKTQQWSQDWKRSITILIPRKGRTKEYSNHQTITLISHAGKVMLKILHENFQMSKLVVEKAEEPEFKLPTFAGS